MPSVDSSAAAPEQSPEMVCPHLKKLAEQKETAQKTTTTAEPSLSESQSMQYLVIQIFQVN